jgi:glucose/arabinose dehydrogenase
VRSLLGLMTASCLGTLAAPLLAAPLDPNFVETKVVTGVTTFTGMAWATDASHRLFALRKIGEVRVIENGKLLPTPFATIPVVTTSECGAIGIAVDPDFASNGYVYVFVTVSATEQQIWRFTAAGNVGTNPTVLVRGLPTKGINHDGGAIEIGADGKLYWAIGDTGSPRNGIDGDLLSLAAKVGRANRDGSVPQDNPFFDGDGPNNDYIWARGFRNPFTMTFQPGTGQLWLSVVGNNYEQVFTPKVGDHAGWDNLESNQPAGYLAPIISYDTNAPTPRIIAATGAVRSGGVVTVTTSVAHRMRPGAKITLAGVTDSSFDTTAFISSTSELSFSFPQAGPDATSGGGTATPMHVGGAVTGGAFLDSTAVPAAFRGDFFFGDYNTGNLMRAELDAMNRVTAVDLWGTGLPKVIDMAIGPDGDLWYAAHTGGILRARYALTSQTLVVSRLNMRLLEGGKAGFGVRLGVAPARDVVVTTEWYSGDTDVGVIEGGSLTFTPTNWAEPQRVLLAAAHDFDSLEDSAKVRVAASGLGKPIVSVKVTDDETFSAVVSPGALGLDEGTTQQLQVSLTQPPTGPIEVSVARTSGDVSVTVVGGLLAFDANNWSTPQAVTISAAADDDGDGAEATLSVSGSGLTTRDVEVTVHDTDESPPDFVSTPIATAVVGASYNYDVDAEGLPEPTYSLDVAPAGMTIDASSGLISWVPTTEGQETITVRAQNGVQPDAQQSFELHVVADGPPNCTLTAPGVGDVISGVDAEFFGDVTDDVGAVRAEFYVDGELAYEDENTEGHYHLGGTHNQFDTTQLVDGEHVLTFTGYDTAGQSCTAEIVVTVDNGGGLGAGGAGPGGGASPGAEAGAGVVGVPRGGAGDDDPEPSAAGTPQGGATAGSSGAGSGEEDGCGCRVQGGVRGSAKLAWLAVLALVVRRRRLRR